MSNQKFWDRHDPVLIFLGIVCFVVVIFGVGLGVYNNEPAWHDTGTVRSVGHMYGWDDGSQKWVVKYNATIVTHLHGAITLYQTPTCLFCPSFDLTGLRVNETIGIMQTNGGQYQIQELQ